MPEVTPINPPEPPTAQSGLSDNAAGALAYLFIPAIVFLVMEPYNKKSFVRFHSMQSILLAVASFVIMIVIGIGMGVLSFFLPWFVRSLMFSLIDLAWLVLGLFLIFSAFKGNRVKLPIIGDIAEKQAGV